MAAILRSYSQSLSSVDSFVSFLVIGTSELCEKVSSGLLQSGKERRRRVVVHQCESIAQVVRNKPETSVDFILFAINGSISQPLSEIELNINSIDEQYVVTGRIILLHCNGVPNILGLTYHKALTICAKYNFHFMSANVFEPESCQLIGKRILNFAEALLGFNSGIPNLC